MESADARHSDSCTTDQKCHVIDTMVMCTIICVKEGEAALPPLILVMSYYSAGCRERERKGMDREKVGREGKYNCSNRC